MKNGKGMICYYITLNKSDLDLVSALIVKVTRNKLGEVHSMNSTIGAG